MEGNSGVIQVPKSSCIISSAVCQDGLLSAVHWILYLLRCSSLATECYVVTLVNSRTDLAIFHLCFLWALGYLPHGSFNLTPL